VRDYIAGLPARERDDWAKHRRCPVCSAWMRRCRCDSWTHALGDSRRTASASVGGVNAGTGAGLPPARRSMFVLSKIPA